MKNYLLNSLVAILFLIINHPLGAKEIIVSNSTELQNAINNVQGGDTISLQSANYGDFTISGKNNSSFVIIQAYIGSTPVFSRIDFHNSSYWKLFGINIKPRFSSGADGKTALDLNGSYLAAENCVINYSEDISGWTDSDWLARSGNGIAMDGDHISVLNNTITVIDHGISCDATNSLVSGNMIANFRGDGIRGLSDDVVYEYNTIKNSFDVDDNHDDGFQSWSYGSGGVGTGTVLNVALHGNTIINYEDPNQPYKGNLQGVGLFDGMFENWVVENNLVITNHWHGISFYGAINCKIINNTVIDNDLAPSPDPWIMIHDHKNGTPSSGVIVRNNIATDYSITGGVTEDHNIEITMNDASTYFLNPSGGSGDYHLNSTSPAIDAGSGDDAPNIDKDGVTRPQGSGWDLGCYEYSDATSVETSNNYPTEFQLFQNYPNPFNPITRIRFVIPNEVRNLKDFSSRASRNDNSLVTLKVYDVLGNEIATLVDDYKPAGEYEVIFDGNNLSSTIYYSQLIVGNYMQTRKMLLLK